MAFNNIKKLYNLYHILVLNNSLCIYSSCPASGKHSCVFCFYNYAYSI